MISSPIPGTAFGHYDVERVLGRGAMGTVYLARDRRIGRRVALKTISIAAGQADDSTSPHEIHHRLQREAELSGSLSHANIVALYEAGYEDDRISYLAMEYVEGKTLQDLKKPLDIDIATRIIAGVLRGLAYAHAAGITHRDIKPANILLTADGTAKIADFGIARPRNSSLTVAGTLMGTPNYMSPEQILGQPLTPKADVFSAGVMLFEMLTGVKPFAAADLTGTLHNILRAEVPHASELNAAVPRALGDLIVRMVAKDPQARPTAEEVGATLRGTISPVVPVQAQSRPHVWIAAAVGIVILAITGAVIATHRAARPTVEITPARLQELDDKTRELDRAETSLQAGRYQEALDRFNAYLIKYPMSTPAIDGRYRARTALARQDSNAPATKPKHRSKDEDISPSELLNRIKKVFKH